MGTKAVDETADTSAAGAEGAPGADVEGPGGPQGAEVTKSGEQHRSTADAEGGAAGEAAYDESDDEPDDADSAAEGAVGEPAAASAGVGQGAGAVVAAALGVVGLSGGWLGTVASARESLIGQLKTSRSASVADQVQQVYGDSWRTTALIGGFFALAALVVGVGVLLRPAFGDPERVQAPWIKSVAWGGVALGVIGLVLAIAKYTDLLLGLPSTS
ncbi:hypothetical protein [Streptomyces silvensis]|uniref:Uncharacterized protein n=1 Tax=Streptomyces silvensis TaxID=1765722 RepID=A0A0W7WWI0_9ACTN|nr:hypothetical protein [Streptomyces silvensis]KUF14955.1 hypothetical protein AT728_36450 [Streptomyces silvensis]